MLYCPKCNRAYKKGTQRFCSVEGARLLPAPDAREKTQKVFSEFLRPMSAAPRADEKASSPAFDPKTFGQTFQPTNSKIFKNQSASPSSPSPEKPSVEPEKPLIRLIRPNEIPSSQASLGDRKSNPSGRQAVSWENSKVLLGQTVKGRYAVTEKIEQDETSISYLAEDKITPGKQVVVRVLMNEQEDDLQSRIFAEERVSLAHINHPNVAKVFDSGELLEGKPFIVTEFVDGFSLREKLSKTNQFDAMRTARIIRQASYALSEVHQNGVLHRNLKPGNIVLTVSEAATEQAKVTDFGIFDGRSEYNLENASYAAPEQLDGRLPNFASDIYSLAVIAYQMLTGRLPFKFSSAEGLLKAQREGMKIAPSHLRLDVSRNVDEVLEKALSYAPTDRYPKARDFGDAFYNALAAPPEKAAEIVENPDLKRSLEKEIAAPPVDLKAVASGKPVESKALSNAEQRKEAAPEEIAKNSGAVKSTGNLAWEKRSPEPVKVTKPSRLWLFAVAAVALAAVIWGIWQYFLSRPPAPEFVPAQPAASADRSAPENLNIRQAKPTSSAEIEAPPLPRQVAQPPGTTFFENSRESLKGEALKNFRGFSVYYPQEWARAESPANFLDLSKKAATGTPVEQMLVSWYESRGTFKADVERFPALVQDSNKKLSAIVPDYRFISSGEITVNNGWRAFEMKFEGAGETINGEKIKLWGRRLFIPAARQGARSGYVVTMLATSLSPDVMSADDIGIKGELGQILETFEPSPLD